MFERIARGSGKLGQRSWDVVQLVKGQSLSCPVIFIYIIVVQRNLTTFIFVLKVDIQFV